jgi:hypothetical protein
MGKALIALDAVALSSCLQALKTRIAECAQPADQADQNVLREPSKDIIDAALNT